MYMKISQKGIDLIKSFEGCYLTAYKCPAGVWTIGYGTTGAVDGKSIASGMKITKEKAEQLLKKDLEKFEKDILKYDSVYHWTQGQFDAMVSFAYNVGSIHQLTANGTRSIEQIAEKILAYNKAAGKVLNGLVRRRKAEQTLFLSDKETNNQSVNTNISTYYPKCNNSCNTIVEGLKDIDQETSYSFRKELAIKNGIMKYSGTAEQNIKLLELLKKGKLKR